MNSLTIGANFNQFVKLHFKHLFLQMLISKDACLVGTFLLVRTSLLK